MDDRARAEDLDRFLDGLAVGNGDATGVDPELARVARAYRTLGRAPAPAGARARVWRDVATRSGTEMPATVFGSMADGTVSRGAPRYEPSVPIAGPSVAPPTRRSVFAQRAAAWVLVVLAVLGYVAIARDGQRPKTIPAAVVATPAPAQPAIATVFTATLPAAALPSGDRISSGLTLFTLPVGARTTWEPGCCPGPMIEYVIAGSYGVRAAAPITVVRGDGTTAEVPAGAEVDLAAGDALISRNETAVETWNSGAVPTVLVNWMFIGGRAASRWLDGMNDVRHGFALPPGPVTVTLRRVTAPSGTPVVLDELAAPQFGVAYQGSGDLIRRTDGSVAEVESRPPSTTFVAYVLRVDGGVPATPAAGG